MATLVATGVVTMVATGLAERATATGTVAVAAAASALSEGVVAEVVVSAAAVGVLRVEVAEAVAGFRLPDVLAPAPSDFCLAARPDPPVLVECESAEVEELLPPVSADAVHGQLATARPSPAANTAEVRRADTVADAMEDSSLTSDIGREPSLGRVCNGNQIFAD
ncbi:hypothetical protein [Mycobacterium sp. DL592]|uniref:hypothetical protein n=1 Tax=Mycobacterium sp. DL592 TaxID=2675524 RepID=UPI001420B98E|nr:hypothetical protein [Mycobacterium sp. DL592]